MLNFEEKPIHSLSRLRHRVIKMLSWGIRLTTAPSLHHGRVVLARHALSDHPAITDEATVWRSF